MDSILTTRMDEYVKEAGSEVIRKCGYTPSSAVRALFEYAIEHESLPFQKAVHPDAKEIKKRVAAFDSCCVKDSINLTNDEIRAARIGEQYGLDA